MGFCVDFCSIPPEYVPRSGIAGSYGNSVCLQHFEELPDFSQVAVPFYSAYFFFLNNDGHRELGSVVFNVDSRAKGLGSDPSWETEQFPSPF